jgi:hypothetical protein
MKLIAVGSIQVNNSPGSARADVKCSQEQEKLRIISEICEKQKTKMTHHQ